MTCHVASDRPDGALVPVQPLFSVVELLDWTVPMHGSINIGLKLRFGDEVPEQLYNHADCPLDALLACLRAHSCIPSLFPAGLSVVWHKHDGYAEGSSALYGVLVRLGHDGRVADGQAVHNLPVQAEANALVAAVNAFIVSSSPAPGDDDDGDYIASD